MGRGERVGRLLLTGFVVIAVLYFLLPLAVIVGTSFTTTAYLRFPPEGFTLDNTAQAILGVKEGGGQALRLDVVRVPTEQSLTDYLNSGWIENIDAKSVEIVTINGFPAATAGAKGDQWAFRLFAVRFGSDVYRFIFATKHMTPEIDRAFRESVASFRRMSIAESKAARPLLPAIAVFYLVATVWSAVAYWRGRGGMWKGRAAAAP